MGACWSAANREVGTLMNRSRTAAAILASTALLVASPAFAVDTGSDHGDIAVTLHINEECLLATDGLLDFDETGIVDANVYATSELTIECTKHSAYEIGLSNGANAVGSQRKLKLAGETDTLNYQLYTDNTYGTVWGSSSNTVGSEDATGEDETHTIYGRIDTHQNAPAGDYTDTVTATIWYVADEEP